LDELDIARGQEGGALKMADKDETLELLKRLVETTQDLFIFQGLQSGLKSGTMKALLRVNTDRITRVSKLVTGKKPKRG
jgi:hypothetical protein